MRCVVEVLPLRCLGCNGELDTMGRAKVCPNCGSMYVTPIPFDAEDEIMDAVHVWHALDSLAGLPLHSYLGWTWAEYAAWLEGKGPT